MQARLSRGLCMSQVYLRYGKSIAGDLELDERWQDGSMGELFPCLPLLRGRPCIQWHRRHGYVYRMAWFMARLYYSSQHGMTWLSVYRMAWHGYLTWLYVEHGMASGKQYGKLHHMYRTICQIDLFWKLKLTLCCDIQRKAKLITISWNVSASKVALSQRRLIFRTVDESEKEKAMKMALHGLPTVCWWGILRTVERAKLICMGKDNAG